MAEKSPFITVDYNGTTVDYIRKIIYAVVRIVVHTINHYVVLPHVFWMVLLRPLMYVKPAVYWLWEGFGFKLLLMLVASWEWNAGYTGWWDEFLSTFVCIWIFRPIAAVRRDGLVESCMCRGHCCWGTLLTPEPRAP